MNEELVVKGFCFSNEADAELAKEELEKIEYLDFNMNYANISKVAQLYDKALDSKMFKTPIGWKYLDKLRNILLENGYIEAELRPIPMNTYFARTISEEPLGERIRPKKRHKDAYKDKYIVTLTLSIGLVIVVIAMFIIATMSDTPNMINYRDAIVNEYATWEQDIKNREDAVRTKERELGMISPLSKDEQEQLRTEEQDE